MNYYFLDGKERVGPFGLSDMTILINRGVVNSQTRFAREGDPDWKQIAAFPELQAIRTHKIGVRTVVIIAIIVAFGSAGIWKINKNNEEDRQTALQQARFERRLEAEEETYGKITNTSQWDEGIKKIQDRLAALREEREAATDEEKIAQIDQKIAREETSLNRLNLTAAKALAH